VKQVHTAKHAAEAHLVKGFLESHGIEATVRGEFLTSGWGELPVDLCSVWVADDAQFACLEKPPRPARWPSERATNKRFCKRR
jgi:hypothetical protein